jgi:hypothetical protein
VTYHSVSKQAINPAVDLPLLGSPCWAWLLDLGLRDIGRAIVAVYSWLRGRGEMTGLCLSVLSLLFHHDCKLWQPSFENTATSRFSNCEF